MAIVGDVAVCEGTAGKVVKVPELPEGQGLVGVGGVEGALGGEVE